MTVTTTSAVGRRAHARVRTLDCRPLAVALLVLVAGLGLTLVLGHHSRVAVAGATVLALVVPGLGPVLATSRAVLPTPFVSALLLGTGWTTLVGLGCAWLQWQSAPGQFAILAAPAVVGAVRALVRPTDRSVRLPPPRWQPRGPYVACALLLAVVIAAAAGAVVHARDQPVDAYGLLPMLGPLFLVAIAAALGVVAIGALRARSPALTTAGLVTIAALATCPPALMTHYFLSGWVYKHLGVVDIIARGLPLGDPNDVYQGWPGFFGVGAIVQTLSGVPPLTYANAAAPVFVLLCGYGLATSVRLLFRSRLVTAVSVLIFLCSMWAGQFYYAPQTFGLMLAMLLQAQFMTMLRARAPSTARYAATTVTFAIGYLATVVSHQLSPFVLLAQLTPLFVLRLVPRRLAIPYVLLAVTPFLWLALHWTAVPVHGVLSGFSLANAEGVVSGPTSPQQLFASRLAHAVGLTIWLAGAAAAASYWRRLRPVLPAVVLAFAPFTVMAAGNYGGELINRLWLFTSPWFGALVALRVADVARGSLLPGLHRWLRRSVVPGLIGLCGIGLLGSAQATTFGMFPMLAVDGDEVAAARWLDEDTPPGSSIVLAMSLFPDRISAGYAERNPLHEVNDPTLIEYDYLLRGLRSGAPGPGIASEIRSEFGPHSYIVFSATMARQNDYYGTLPRGRLEELSRAMVRSGLWRIAYRNGDVTVLTPRLTI